jgi:hypothetical protein
MKYLKPIGSAINGLVCGALTFVVLSGCGGGEEDTGGTSKPTASNTNISLAASTLNINEGGVSERKTDNIKLRLSQSHSTNIVVNYVTIDDTALGGRDYEPKNGSVTFSPGEREKNIQVTVIGNNNNDEDKRFNVSLTLATGDNAKLINENAAIVIKDDDPEPKVTLELDRLDVREGVGSVDIVAKLDRGSYQTVTATLAFAGLASKTNDYNVVSSEIIFAPYETTAHTTITIFEDDIIEGTETIDIAFERLSNGSEGLANTLKVLILGDLRLTDSGVISYYNNGRFDALVPDGEHPYQDADFGLDTNDLYANRNGVYGFFYNKIDDAGNALPANNTRQECTYDAHTGLTWEIKSEFFHHDFSEKPTAEELEYELMITGQHYNNRNGRYRYYNADDTKNGGSRGSVNNKELTAPVFASQSCMFPPRDHPMHISSVTQRGCTTDSYVALVNKTAKCGAIDWRLPSINELQTLMVYEVSHRGFDQDYFPDTDASEAYNGQGDFVFLSSTPSVDNDASVWCMDVSSRRVKLCNKNYPHHVRLVRGNEF